MKSKEDNLQAACIRWFRYQYPDKVLFAIPNGGSRNPIEAAKLKRTGTLAGVADLFLMAADYNPVTEIGSYGLFIELKVGKNGQTESQKSFQYKALMAGYQYRVCRTFDEFQEIINEYLKQ